MDFATIGVVALAIMMGVAALSSRLASWLGVPLPVVVAALGFGYGGFVAASGAVGLAMPLDTYEIWFFEQLALQGPALAIIFLPPLLFEMALSVNVRRMLDDVAAVALLAVFAVVAATVIVGFTLYWASSLSIVACLLIGAACSTTDPAAVISTFREIGAPRRLSILLEGESLLNDAAAIAIFSLLLSVAAMETVTTLGVIIDFGTAFALGACVGIAGAALAAFVYPLLGQSAAAEVSVTVALAYGVYLVSEEVVGASGVVAVVFAGLTTGSVGFVRMGPRNWNTVLTIWGQIGYWASVLVLFVTAAMTPALIAKLTPAQMLLTAIVYFGALAARALVLFGAMPVLDYAGLTSPMGPRQKLLVMWGGVRGAVTLVLALSVSEMVILGEEAAVIAALSAAFAFATLGINATTLALVTRKLGLNRLSPTDAALRDQLVAGSIERARKVARELAEARSLDGVAIDTVLEQLARRRDAFEAEARSVAEGERIPFGERLRLGLAILGGQEARLVRRAFEEGAIGPRVTLRLRRAAEELSDVALTEGRNGYERLAEALTHGDRSERYAFFVYRWFGVDLPLRTSIEMRLTSLIETDRILLDLSSFARKTLAPMIGKDAADNLDAAMALRRAAVELAIRSISLQYPKYSIALETTLIARSALRKERLQQERNFADGVIGPELHRELVKELDAREHDLDAPPVLDLTLAPRALLDRAPLFNALSEEQKMRVAKRMKTRMVAPGETILSVGERGDAMFFVVSGVLEARRNNESDAEILKNGDFFGELAIFAPLRRRRSSILAMDYGRLLVLSRKDFRLLAQSEPEIEKIIRSAAQNQLDRSLPLADTAYSTLR